MVAIQDKPDTEILTKRKRFLIPTKRKRTKKRKTILKPMDFESFVYNLPHSDHGKYQRT